VRRHGKPRAELMFADLPGYGYARVPKEITAKWGEFINPYLEMRPSLALCLSLVDVTIPPQQLDIQLLDWLRHADRRFLIVATKADRISNNQLRTSLNRLCEQLQVETDQIVPFSARARIGQDELWRAIRLAVRLEDHGAEPMLPTGTE